MSKTVKSPKGNDLPLTNLKGKDYLMVAYRIQWLNEDPSVGSFDIQTSFSQISDEQTVAHCKVILYDTTGKFLRAATATKRETKKDFSDHTEKAETSAIGRALAMLGYGTQFAIADLDEGERLADSPLVGGSVTSEVPVKRATFKKVAAVPSEPTPSAPSAPVASVSTGDGGWS
jgi:hypothetical protein